MQNNSNDKLTNSLIPLHVGLVDSFRLRIPLEKVQLLDQTLTNQFIKYYPSIDHIDEMLNEPKPFIHTINGITTRIFLKSYRDGNVSETYIVFTVSAKMLRSNYWDGITIDNLEYIYETLMLFRVFYCDYRTFLNAKISDIDLCLNFRVRRPILEEAFQSISKAIKPHLHKHLNVFLQKNNLGLELNKREKATPSVPYVKIYYKEIEMLTKSVEFYKAYLEPADLTNLARIEYNIKNAKHKKHLNKKYTKLLYTTVYEFFTISTSEKEDLFRDIILSGIPEYINTIPKTHINTDLKPMDRVLKYYIENLIFLGFDKQKLLGFEHEFGMTEKDIVNRSRTKSKMRKLIDQITVDSWTEIQLDKNGELHELLYEQLKLNL